MRKRRHTLPQFKAECQGEECLPHSKVDSMAPKVAANTRSLARIESGLAKIEGSLAQVSIGMRYMLWIMVLLGIGVAACALGLIRLAVLP